MKISPQPNREQGFFATIVMMAIIGIMLILVAANAKRLYQLDRELKLVEQAQIRRLNPTAAPANQAETDAPKNTSAANAGVDQN